MLARFVGALKRVEAPTWLAWVLPVFAWAALAYPGYFELHSGFRPIFNLNDLARNLPGLGWAPVIGQPYDWLRGEGALAYWLALLPRALGASPVVAIKCVFAASLALGSLGMYAWARRALGRWPGLLAALVYALLPVNLAAVYVRGALAETVLLGLVPWVLWAATRPGAFSAGPTAPLAVLLAAAFWTQAGLALWLAAMALVYILLGTRTPVHTVGYVASADQRGQDERLLTEHPDPRITAETRRTQSAVGDLRVLRVSAVPGLPAVTPHLTWGTERSSAFIGWLGGVLLGLAGLLPVLIRHGLGGKTYADFADHFVYLHQLLWPDWGNGPSIAGSYDTLTFQLGLVACGLATVGLVLRSSELARSETGQSEREIGQSEKEIGQSEKEIGQSEKRTGHLVTLSPCHLFCPLALVVLVTTLSAPIWRLLPFLARTLTYPWQLLLLAGPWLAWLAGLGAQVLVGLLPEDEREHESVPLVAALLAMVLLGSYTYLNPTPVSGPVPDAPLAIFGDNEIALLDVEPVMMAASGASAAIDARWQALRPLANDYTVFFHVVGSDGQVIGQKDTMPQDNKLPTTQWRPGQVVGDHYEAVLKTVAPAGNRDQYYLGWYQWQTGERLRTATDDKVVVMP